MESIGLSQRKARAVATCNLKTYRRMVRITDDAALKERLCNLAAQCRRFGYRRILVLLRREGLVVNREWIYRVYAAEKLQIRKRLERRVALGRGEAITPASRPNARWSLDFVHDRLHNGRRVRTLNVVDDFTRESLAIEVDTSLSGTRVVRVLDPIATERGAYPQTLVMNNGTELTSLAMSLYRFPGHVATLQSAATNRTLRGSYSRG